MCDEDKLCELGDKNNTVKQLRKRGLTTIDTVVAVFVIGPFAIAFWRGTWSILDIYKKTRHNALPVYECFFFSVFALLTFGLLRDTFPNMLIIIVLQDRKPLDIPGRCSENQLLYPEDTGPDDYTCDCGPGFLYYGVKDTCYEAYRQGPCKNNEYLILKKPSVTPECAKNPCRTDSMVRYKGRCHKLHKSNGCPRKDDAQGILGVNATTLEVACIYGDVSELNLIQVASCPPGSKRASSGACRKPY